MRFDAAPGTLEEARAEAWLIPVVWSRLPMLAGTLLLPSALERLKPQFPAAPGWAKLKAGKALAAPSPSLPVGHVIGCACLSARRDTSPRVIFDSVVAAVREAERLKIRSVAVGALGAESKDMSVEEALGAVRDALKMTESQVRAVLVEPRP